MAAITKPQYNSGTNVMPVLTQKDNNSLTIRCLALLDLLKNVGSMIFFRAKACPLNALYMLIKFFLVSFNVSNADKQPLINLVIIAHQVLTKSFSPTLSLFR